MPSARSSMLDRAQTPKASKPGDLETAPRPVTFRGAGFAPKAGRYSGWIALVLAIGLWQLAGSAGLVNPLFLPTPISIARAIWQLAISGALWHHLSYSIMRIGTGLVFGASRRPHCRFCRRAFASRARRQHPLHLGVVPAPEERVAAAIDPVAWD